VHRVFLSGSIAHLSQLYVLAKVWELLRRAAEATSAGAPPTQTPPTMPTPAAAAATPADAMPAAPCDRLSSLSLSVTTQLIVFPWL
jgi:hypothetical protein